MHLADLQLIDLQISTLFICDADGHLRYIREPGYAESELDPAPRFFMGRTLHGNIWRFRHDLPKSVVHEVDQLCNNEPIASNLSEPPQTAAAIRAILHAHTPNTQDERGPAYWIPNNRQAPAAVVQITDANKHLLEAYFPWKITSRSGFKIGPMTAAIVQNKAVSICYCARLTPAAAEAGVETTKVFRGQGFGSAAVAGWASAIRQRDLLPLYSTTWENLASQSIARKFDMVQYGDDWSIT